MEVIRKIAADSNQMELTKEKYYELYNVAVSLLRTIDLLDPEKGRRAEMGGRESFSYPLVPGTQLQPNSHQPAMPSGSFDLDAVLAGHKPSFAAEFYAARSSFSDPVYAAQAAAAAAAQFAATNNMGGHPSHPSAHPQGHPTGPPPPPTPTATYAMYAQQQQQQQHQQQQQQQHHQQHASQSSTSGHPSHPAHPSSSAQSTQQQHTLLPQQHLHHPSAHPHGHPASHQHGHPSSHPLHPQPTHPPPSQAHHPAHPAAATTVANRMKNFTGEVFFDDVSESRKPKRRRRRTVFATKRNLRCHMCNATETPEWRRGPDGDHTLCNACGLHYAKTLKKERRAREGRKHSIDILLNESVRAVRLV